MKHYWKSLVTSRNYDERLGSFPTLQSPSPTSQSPPARSRSFISVSSQVDQRSTGHGSSSQLGSSLSRSTSLNSHHTSRSQVPFTNGVSACLALPWAGLLDGFTFLQAFLPLHQWHLQFLFFYLPFSLAFQRQSLE